MAKLTAAKRKKVRVWGLPGQKKYPLPDKSHARNALARASEMENKGRISKAQEREIDTRADKVLGKGNTMRKKEAAKHEKKGEKKMEARKKEGRKNESEGMKKKVGKKHHHEMMKHHMDLAEHHHKMAETHANHLIPDDTKGPSSLKKNPGSDKIKDDFKSPARSKVDNGEENLKSARRGY